MQTSKTKESTSSNARCNRIGRLAALLGLSVVWGNCQAFGAQAKCDTFLSHQLSHATSGKLRIIVRFHDQPGPTQLARLRTLGAHVYCHLDIIQAVAASVPARNLAAIRRLPFVESISSDEVVRKTDLFTIGSSYADVAYLNYHASGSGVGVAVLDSGINTVDDLAGKGSGLAASVNFSDDPDATDRCGHGTHVAGILAGSGADSTGPGYTKTFLGIARGAKLLNVKVLDSQGGGSVSGVIQGISWCLSNRWFYNIRVLNLSLGHPVGESYQSDPLCQALESAWKSGLVVVCAAGNDGRLNSNPTSGAANGGYGTNYGSIECPGNDPYVITVGATKSVDGIRSHDQIATYSGRGATRIDHVMKPDLIAPGNRVISTVNESNSFIWSTYTCQVELPLSYYTNATSGYSSNYYILSGTSMAAPVVSGAAAMMLQLNSGLSPDTIKARLMVSADKWGDPNGNADACTYGAGYLNIPNALQSKVTTFLFYAKSPTVSEDGSGNVVVNLLSDIFNLLFGLWGTGINNLGTVYGSRAMWGNNTLSSSRAMWGNGFWSNNSSYTVSSTSLNFSGSGVLLNGEN